MDVCHIIAETTCNTPAYEVWEQHDWERQEGGQTVPDRKLHFTCPAGAR